MSDALDLEGADLTALPQAVLDQEGLRWLGKLDLRWNKLADPPAWLDELRERGCVVLL